MSPLPRRIHCDGPTYSSSILISSAGTRSAFVAEQTKEFISQNGRQPFLCVSGFYSPHEPWVAPQEYLDLYDPEQLTLPSFPTEIDARRSGKAFSDDELRGARHGYYAMISEVDDWVGRILAHLDELELTDDTIVVFTSDHGEWLGEHLKYGKGYPGHDCVTRVPLIVRWPAGVAEPGRTVSDICEGVDVVPTLLAAAGLQLPTTCRASRCCRRYREAIPLLAAWRSRKRTAGKRCAPKISAPSSRPTVRKCSSISTPTRTPTSMSQQSRPTAVP